MRGEQDGAGPDIRWKTSYTVLTLCIGAYFAVRFAQVLVGPVVPLIIDAFGVSRGSIGTSLTGMWVAYALFQLPSGVLADHLGERRVVLVALGTTACATVGVAVAPTALVFAVAMVGLGLGTGAYYNPATALLAREVDELGGAIGTHRIGGQVAGVFAPIVAASIGAQYGWRVATGLGALVAVVAAVLFIWKHAPTAPARADATERELLAPRALLELLRRPRTRGTTFMMTLVEFVGLATMAFLPAFLTEVHELPIQQANLLFAVFFGVSALSQPFGGWLSDRTGREVTLALQSAAGVLGYSALIAGNASIIVPGIILAGGATSSTPVLQSRMLDDVHATNRGKGFGMFRTLYLLLGATGPASIGTIADVAGWVPAFGLLAALFVVVLLSVLVQSR